MSLTAHSRLEVRTPRQFKVQFRTIGLESYIQTPQLSAHLEIPDSVSVMGQTLDLSPLQRLVAAPFNGGVQAAQALMARAAAPELPVAPADATSVWMLTTYLDDTLRVTRDDGGKVYVLLKELA